jgi:hypothetical protein
VRAIDGRSGQISSCYEDLLLQIAAQIERARSEWFGAVPPVHISRPR